jgi:hypothetical protein
MFNKTAGAEEAKEAEEAEQEAIFSPRLSLIDR